MTDQELERNGFEDGEEVFIMTDENGVEHEMIVVYTFEADERAYAVLLDRNDPEADGVIFRLEEDGADAYLVPIEEDAEWERVEKIFSEIAAQEAERA